MLASPIVARVLVALLVALLLAGPPVVRRALAEFCVSSSKMQVPVSSPSAISDRAAASSR